MLRLFKKRFFRELLVTWYVKTGVETKGKFLTVPNLICEKLVLYVDDQQIHLTAFQDQLYTVIRGAFAKFSEVELAETHDPSHIQY